MRQPFHKTIGNFDRIVLRADGQGEWLDLTMHVGLDVERITMTFHSDEAARDLHYALGRYIAGLPSKENQQ